MAQGEADGASLSAGVFVTDPALSDASGASEPTEADLLQWLRGRTSDKDAAELLRQHGELNGDKGQLQQVAPHLGVLVRDGQGSKARKRNLADLREDCRREWSKRARSLQQGKPTKVRELEEFVAKSSSLKPAEVREVVQPVQSPGADAEWAECLRLLQGDKKDVRDAAKKLRLPQNQRGLEELRQECVLAFATQVLATRDKEALREKNVRQQLLQKSHEQDLEEARKTACMNSYVLTGPGSEMRFVDDANVNVFPGMRNIGNTCWLNALLQCTFHVAPLRRWLQDRARAGSVSFSQLPQDVLADMTQKYWSRIAKNSIMVPIKMLRRLVQAQPHLGGALQQDVADAFQYFGLDVRLLHVELAAASESVCANGVVQAALDDVLLASEVAPLDFILEVALPAPHVAAPPPPCVAVHCPTVFPAGDGFRYTRCRISGADSPLTIGSGLNAAEYRLRAYVEHRHNGQPGRNSRAGGHYVAYFKNNSSWYLANDSIVTHRPVTNSTSVLISRMV